VLEKVNISVGPIQVKLSDLEPAGTGRVSGNCNSQLALFTTERQRELRPAVSFSKTCLKRTSVCTEGNFTKLIKFFTLSLSRIMLDYYFVPIILNSSYPPP